MISIEQGVDDINTAYLSMAHIVWDNPIMNDTSEIKDEYIKRLKGYLKVGGWNRRKFQSSVIEAYEKILSNSSEMEVNLGIEHYKYFILFDFLHILGYETKKLSVEKLKEVEKQYLSDFPCVNNGHHIFNKIIFSVQGSEKRLTNLERDPVFANEANYIRLIKENVVFKKKKPCRVIVTATMSAGKSTFINALTGKYICLSQNMACTSKIHSIINKAFEDGFSYEYDHDLVMTAGKEELLNDNELNTSDKIVVSTHFVGYLGERRIVVNDSPGVNFSGDSEHKRIANKLIGGRNYNLLIYVMNATQLATNDENEHLDFVKQTIGRTPIIFVMNRVDCYNLEEEDIQATIERQIEYLKKKGFKNPIVCPLSAKAGYLAKQYGNGSLSRIEKRELYNYVDKFEKMNLPEYYRKYFGTIEIADSNKEEEQLIKTCGLAYVEKIIDNFIKGGKVNGTDLR